MGAEDLVCLGETVRFSKSLTSLRMEGFSRMAEIIPVLIALQVNIENVVKFFLIENVFSKQNKNH